MPGAESSGASKAKTNLALWSAYHGAAMQKDMQQSGVVPLSKLNFAALVQHERVHQKVDKKEWWLAKISYARQNLIEERAAKRAAKAKQEREKVSQHTEAQAAKGPVKALEGLLQEAIALELTEDGLVKHMLQNVKIGRFTAEYYLDMWVRRMTEAGVEGPAVRTAVLALKNSIAQQQKTEERSSRPSSSPTTEQLLNRRSSAPAQSAARALRTPSTTDAGQRNGTPSTAGAGEPSRASHARLYQAIAGAKAAGVSANTIAEAEQKLMLAIERDARREQERAQLQVYRDRMSVHVAAAAA